jgi:hypothetical protein
LANDFIERPFANKEFLCDVAEAVKCGSSERKQVAFQLIATGDVSAIRARDVVTRDKQASPCHTNKDATDLSPVVTDLEEKKRYDNDDHDSPEVDELRREDCGIAICEDGKVVALDVTEGQDDVCETVSTAQDGSGSC